MTDASKDQGDGLSVAVSRKYDFYQFWGTAIVSIPDMWRWQPFGGGFHVITRTPIDDADPPTHLTVVRGKIALLANLAITEDSKYINVGQARLLLNDLGELIEPEKVLDALQSARNKIAQDYPEVYRDGISYPDKSLTLLAQMMQDGVIVEV